jgi:sugar phosphate isomerase/epimerase
MDLPAVLRKRFGTTERLAEMMAATGISIPVIGTSMKLVGASDEMKSALIEYIEWADALNVPYLRVFDGGAIGSAEAVPAALATLAWWSEYRTKTSVRVDLAVETHDFLLGGSELKAFLRAAPGCPILWDTHHTWRRGGVALEESWQVLRNNVVHLHVKDSSADQRQESGFAYCLPGGGEFPMATLLDLLTRDRYQGVISLEWEKAWHHELPELEAALSAAMRSSWW